MPVNQFSCLLNQTISTWVKQQNLPKVKIQFSNFVSTNNRYLNWSKNNLEITEILLKFALVGVGSSNNESDDGDTNNNNNITWPLIRSVQSETIFQVNLTNYCGSFIQVQLYLNMQCKWLKTLKLISYVMLYHPNCKLCPNISTFPNKLSMSVHQQNYFLFGTWNWKTNWHLCAENWNVLHFNNCKFSSFSRTPRFTL